MGAAVRAAFGIFLEVRIDRILLIGLIGLLRQSVSRELLL